MTLAAPWNPRNGNGTKHSSAACRISCKPVLPKAWGVDKINPFLGLTYPFLWTVSPNSIYLFPSFHGSKINNLTFVHLPWLVSAAIKHPGASTHRMLSKVFEANQSVSFSPMAVSKRKDKIILQKGENNLQALKCFECMFKNKRYEEGSDCRSSHCHLTNFFYCWASSPWPWLSSAHFSCLLLPLISDIAMVSSVHHAEGKNSHFLLFGHWEQQLLKEGEMVHFKSRVPISDLERFPDLCEKLGNFTLWWKPRWMWGELGKELAWWHCLENWERVGKQLARETPGDEKLLVKEQEHMPTLLKR